MAYVAGAFIEDDDGTGYADMVEEDDWGAEHKESPPASGKASKRKSGEGEAHMHLGQAGVHPADQELRLLRSAATSKKLQFAVFIFLPPLLHRHAPDMCLQVVLTPKQRRSKRLRQLRATASAIYSQQLQVRPIAGRLPFGVPHLLQRPTALSS